MLRPRIIPCLLIHKKGLVKTKFFKSPKYIGDPINSVRIFNELKVDELMILDIDATVNRAEPNYELISMLAAECSSPLCYGGGIKNVDQALRILDLGVEKIAVSAAAVANPSILSSISSFIGQQSVVAVIDTRSISTLFGKEYKVFTHNGNTLHKEGCIELAKIFENSGAGEIVINSIDRDGEMLGYNIELAQEIRSVLKVPLTFLGGAGSLNDINELIQACGLVGAAAGSLFFFKGKYNSVLINYPSVNQKNELFQSIF